MRFSNIYRQLQSEDQLYFLHIQKTAGTTFRSIVDSYFPNEQICPAYFWDEFFEIPEDLRQTYRLYRGHFSYNLHFHLARLPVIITMLRHPLERVISNMLHIGRYPEHVYHERYKSMDLLAFLHSASEMRNLQTRMIAPPPDKDVDIYSYWDATPGDLERALERLEQFEFCGITERFADSVSLLTYTLGWRPVTKIDSLNAAPESSKKTPMPQKVIDTIIELNEKDFVLYERAQKLFDVRYNQMLFELLDAHYLSVFNAPAPAPSPSISVDISIPMPGDNWHTYEQYEEYGYRWTGPKTTSTLDLILQQRISYTVELQVVMGITEDVLNSLKLEVNQHLIQLEYERGDHGLIFRGVIPASYLSTEFRVTRLMLHVVKTQKPVELGMNSDSRELGVAISAITVTPYARAGA